MRMLVAKFLTTLVNVGGRNAGQRRMSSQQSNLLKYLLNLVLGLWPENVFQINSVKTWMNLLTFVSDMFHEWVHM